MNNIYVEGELPKSCKDCPCMNNDGFGGYDCNLYYKKHEEILDCDYYSDTIPKDCPIKPLSDRLAEERKKVVQEIRNIAKKIARPTTEYDDNKFDYDIDAIELDNLLQWFQDGEQDFVKTYLDQIDRGE